MATGCFKPLLHLREAPLDPSACAMVVIDVQNFCCHPKGAQYRDTPEEELSKQEPFFWKAMPAAVSNIKDLLQALRRKRI
mmetsp:Transcript_75004/g.207667  ORF Transcript_75004/g.207667 Transcript_75004/m.207667 type:complete len:80 (+) Transcript_75004:72-311(+)